MHTAHLARILANEAPPLISSAVPACLCTTGDDTYCMPASRRSEREEEFYQISVDVKGFDSLEKSLEGYVAGELMEGDNAYYCEELGQRVAAVRRTCIRELPQTLVVHLKRFEYDHLNMTRWGRRGALGAGRGGLQDERVPRRCYKQPCNRSSLLSLQACRVRSFMFTCRQAVRPSTG